MKRYLSILKKPNSLSFNLTYWKSFKFKDILLIFTVIFMQVPIAKKQNGEILELDDLSYQFILWLNETGYTEPDSIYARSTLKTTVKEFNELSTQHEFQGEDEMLIPQLNYFVELNTWACWDDNKPMDEDQPITIVFEICDVVFNRDSMKEEYRPVEITYLKSFLKSFME